MQQQQISRAQAAAAAAAAKAAFVAVQQQHLNNGGMGPTYNTDNPLFREANSILAAAGVTNNMDHVSTLITNNATVNEGNTVTNLLAVNNPSVTNADVTSPLMAMNLTTNTKSPTENFMSTGQGEIIGQSQPNGNIDLTLPITSTYLKRMKALGLTTGYESLYGQHSALFNVSNSIHSFISYFTLNSMFQSTSLKVRKVRMKFSVRRFIFSINCMNVR